MSTRTAFAPLIVCALCIPLTGCVPNYQAQSAPAPAPPPLPPTYRPAPQGYGSEPPHSYEQAPALAQLAERNGFLTGRTDGFHDSERGNEPIGRRTRAYHDTPGYDARLGPFEQYRDAFRNAYLRGYDQGYSRR